MSGSSDDPCQYCVARPACIANAVEQGQFHPSSHRIYKRKDFLIRSGDPFKGLYALRSGAAKSTVTIPGGHEQIVHFHYPGDLLGTDGFNQEIHTNNIEFLETSSVCFFNSHELDELMAKSQSLRKQMLKNMSKELAGDHRNLLSLSQLSSAQRLARFILEHSQKFADRGLSASTFDLVMSRTDIANHLGLAIETVSRLLKRFSRDGSIKIQHRTLTILDAKQLQQLIRIPEQS